MFVSYEILWKSFYSNSSIRALSSVRKISTSNKTFEKKDNSEDNVYEKAKSNMQPQEENKKLSKEVAAKKLDELLLSMKKINFTDETEIEIAKPRIFARKQHEIEKKKKMEKLENSLENKLSKAAAEVAEALGGDVNKTKQELLDVLEIKQESDELSQEKHVEEELKETASQQPERQLDLSQLIADMKIDTTSEESTIPLEQTRAYQIKKMMMQKSGREDELIEFFRARRSTRYFSRNLDKVDIFGETPLGIFDVKKFKDTATNEAVLPTWSALHERDLRICLTQPPTNIYEQMILWTKQGKMWRFPIDNEQDWFDEQKIDFTEHVFLEAHLEPWCPTDGPVRHFMELVCVGLSRNPYLTAAEKREHIYWYEEYLRSKNEILERAEVETIKPREEMQQ